MTTRDVLTDRSLTDSTWFAGIALIALATSALCGPLPRTSILRRGWSSECFLMSPPPAARAHEGVDGVDRVLFDEQLAALVGFVVGTNPKALERRGVENDVTRRRPRRQLPGARWARWFRV